MRGTKRVNSRLTYTETNEGLSHNPYIDLLILFYHSDLGQEIVLDVLGMEFLLGCRVNPANPGETRRDLRGFPNHQKI